MKCSRCSKDAVIYLPYMGRALCSSHFQRLFMKRVKRTISKESLVKSGDKMAIACSGGKDSTALLIALADIYEKRKDVELVVLSVDQGFPGQDKLLGGIRKRTEELGIDFRTTSYKKELGMTLPEIFEKTKDEPLTLCSYCGVFRRKILNSVSKKEGCTKIATGHNLDDECQSVVMNFYRGDFERMARLGAKVGVSESELFVQRIKPLREIPEKEAAVFSMLRGWRSKDVSCPYHGEGFRSFARGQLNDAELNYPGTKYNILRMLDNLLPHLKKLDFGELSKCPRCGEPSASGLCRSCEFMEKIKNG